MGTTERPSRTVPHQQRSGSPVTSVSSPPVAILYDCLRVDDTSVAESVSKIRSFLHSSSQIAAARNLRGEEAQGLINLIDQALALPELDGSLRTQCSHLLYKLCKTCELLPASYVLRQELICVGNIHCYGGFADVSEGQCLGRPVAIKHLRFGAKDAFSKIFKRFCREIIGWKCLAHPNILPLFGVSFSTDPRCFRIVSEWMQNGNVMEYARSNPEVNRLRLLSEVMSGATYLHELGIVHGDIKGANILIDDGGTACLADFGLMIISIDLSTIPLSATTVSSAGTVRWMSPELLFDQDSRATRESDCYALGMVIYEVLTGLRPFHHLGPYAAVIAIQKGERPRKPENPESFGFSDTLWWLIQMCWDDSPSARPTAKELFRYFQDASNTWVPPLEYPIPDGREGGTGLDHTSGYDWSIVADPQRSSFFVLAVTVLCVLLLPLT